MTHSQVRFQELHQHEKELLFGHSGVVMPRPLYDDPLTGNWGDGHWQSGTLKQGLTENLTWMSNYKYGFLGDVIICQCPNVNSAPMTSLLYPPLFLNAGLA